MSDFTRYFAEDATTYPSPYGDMMMVEDHLKAVQEARDRGYAAGRRDGYDQGTAKGGADERERILDGVLTYFAVAPKAAEPILRIIEEKP